MPRIQISIKLDEDLLARVDQLAEATGTNRTAVIEQAVKNDLPEQEAFQQSLENPTIRALHKQITRPALLRAIAMLANERMTDEDLAEVVERAPRQRAAVERRVAERKGRKSKTEGE